MVWAGWSVICCCGAKRDPVDPFFLVPNPMLPTQAGRFQLSNQLRWNKREHEQQVCNVRACRCCGAIYACPEEP